MSHRYTFWVVVLLAAFVFTVYDNKSDLLSKSSVVDKKHQNITSSTNAKVIKDYQKARRIFWRSVYPNQATTLYCGETFDSDYRKGFNVEHVFPMSWAKSALGCDTRKQCRVKSAIFNRIEADLHNLYPVRSDVNEARASFAFGEINGEKRVFGKACDFELDKYRRVAEPAPAVRGEVARAMFYMAYKYKKEGLTIFAKQGRKLQSWHRADPPTSNEIKRNDKIESIQGNRNAFIDQPEQLERLIKDHFFF